MATILVTGGTGTLGRPLVDRLLDDGHDVRSLSRRPHTGMARPRPRSYAVDLRDGTGLAEAVAGVDVIVHCASTPAGGDAEAAGQLVAAAKAAGIPHLVYISIVGVDRVPLGYYRTKLAVERLIEESGLGWTVLRTTQFHDLVLRVLQARSKLAGAAAAGGVRVQPVEVARSRRPAGRAGVGAPAGRVADLGGPEVRTLRAAGPRLPAGGRRRRRCRWLPASVTAFRAGDSSYRSTPSGTGVQASSRRGRARLGRAATVRGPVWRRASGTGRVQTAGAYRRHRRREQLVLGRVPRRQQRAAQHRAAAQRARPHLGGQRGHPAEPVLDPARRGLAARRGRSRRRGPRSRGRGRRRRPRRRGRGGRRARRGSRPASPAAARHGGPHQAPPRQRVRRRRVRRRRRRCRAPPPVRTIAAEPAREWKPPSQSVAEGRPAVPGTGRKPISPVPPEAPRRSLPSRTTAAPMPWPSQSRTKVSRSRAAPSRCSARAARLVSFSTQDRAGEPLLQRARPGGGARRAGPVVSRSSPVAGSIRPGAPTPTVCSRSAPASLRGAAPAARPPARRRVRCRCRPPIGTGPRRAPRRAGRRRRRRRPRCARRGRRGGRGRRRSRTAGRSGRAAAAPDSPDDRDQPGALEAFDEVGDGRPGQAGELLQLTCRQRALRAGAGAGRAGR